MKTITKIFMIIALFFAGNMLVAQAPDGFNYQAVIRNGAGEIVSNTDVNIRFTILDELTLGNVLYRETQNLTTNEYGMVNHVIGFGSFDLGNFSELNWAEGEKYLKIEVSLNNGPYNDLGTQQLVSVPYALSSLKSDSARFAANSFWTKVDDNILNANSGNVGIGPQVNDDINLTIESDQLAGIYIDGDSAIYALWSEGNNVLSPSQDDSYGNVGIGTEQLPDTKLTVKSNQITGVYIDGDSAQFALLSDGANVLSPSADNSLGNVGIGQFSFGNAKLGVRSNQDFGLFIDGDSTDQFALYVIGEAGYENDVIMAEDLIVLGNISKGGGSFKIDHPLDPANKYLYHSFVESPDMMNIYNGNVTTDENSEAIITLPEYFSTLNKDFRYQLTSIGSPAQAFIAKEIQGNKFSIKTTQPNVKVSWMVTGIRKDPYANDNRIQVEVDKPEKEKGKYLHPSAYGLSNEYSIVPNIKNQMKTHERVEHKKPSSIKKGKTLNKRP